MSELSIDPEKIKDPLERFRVQREVGRGAAGIVFQAIDQQLGELVALKVIALEDSELEERERFLSEGRLLAALSHPSIVRIVDFGMLPEPVELEGHCFEASTPYLAMEWLAGQNLQERHASVPLTLPQALDVGRQTAAALGSAHEAGVIHRDVKPSNIFVIDNRQASLQAKLVDFGVACADAQSMTHMHGPMIGTPAYMAPEQARGDTVLDPRCDVYSLGATLFELIAGRPPHQGSSPIAMLAKLVSTPAQRLSELMLDVPDKLDDLIAEMLDLEYRCRPSSREVEHLLSALCADPALPLAAGALDEQCDSVHSSVMRFMTTLVALHVVSGAERDQELQRLREIGAEAAKLGRDSIVAYLGARRAHGGEAAQAIEIGRRLAARGGAVGVATGRALVALARPIGEVVDDASRLAREAAPGQLLVDETTTELARGSFEFEASTRGAWLVQGRTSTERRAKELAPFVGREGELEALFDAYRRCLHSSSPAIVSATGPPGIGKSRLAREFVSQLRSGSMTPATQPSPQPAEESKAAEPAPIRVVLARSEAYGRSRALGIAADALCDLLHIAKGTSSLEVAAKLAPMGLIHDENGLLASLLAGEPFPSDIDPVRARDILYLAMTELILRVMGDEPCVLLLEDVQWSDPESVAWFDHLLSRAANRPLFVLLLARPEFWKEDPQRFAGRDHVRLELRPIPRRATMQIAQALIGCGEGDPKLAQVAQQAAGSPLFAEELSRVIAAGKTVASVPTIEAAIQVSLDALDPDARDALVHMSVFGLASWDGGLAYFGIAEVDKVLERLLDADLIVEQETTRLPGNRELWFKHALVRDVAYASASEAIRRELHAKVAAWFAETGGDAATIAEHFDLGGQHERAADFWERAARRALAANALRDAVKMADRALTYALGQESGFARAMLLDEVYSRLDERSADRAEAIEAMADYAYDEPSEVRTMGARARYDNARSAGSDVEDRLLEVVQRSTELGLLDEAARCSATLAMRYAYAGELAMAEAEAAKLLRLAEERGVQSAAVDAWQAHAVVRQTRGELAAGVEARRNAARAARAAGLKQREAMLTMNLGFALTTIGAREEARREIEAGIRMAEEIGSAGTVRLGRMILLGWAAHFGSDPSVSEAIAGPRANADEAATGAWIVKDRVTLGVLFYRGCELLLSGDAASFKRASALLKISAEAYRATDNRDVLPVALGYWAEAERRLGSVEEAEKLAREAADLVEAGAPSLLNEAIIYLALHGALVDMGRLAEARRAIERAMPALLRRVRGLQGTAYEAAFFSLSHNAQLLAAADNHGCVPEELKTFVHS